MWPGTKLVGLIRLVISNVYANNLQDLKEALNCIKSRI